MSKKITLGQFFTKGDVWLDDNVKDFISGYGKVIDPFAGDGDILKHFTLTGGYDIDPTLRWTINNSLLGIPKGDAGDVCVTNPPYLAKNSAVKRKLTDTYAYFDINPHFDDLYLVAIHRCLEAFDKVVAIIPETYISTNHFKDRLVFANIIEAEMFNDTECPVLVAAWGPETIDDFSVYKNSDLVGKWSTISATIPPMPSDPISMKFNDPDGQLGIICFDAQSGKSIRFCEGDVVPKVEIKHTSRAKTRVAIDVPDMEALIQECNRILANIRDTSCDLIMSPFKGNMKSGERRRRLDFALARKIINLAVNNLKSGG